MFQNHCVYCKKNRLLAGHAARKQNGLAGTDNDDAVAPATISTRLYWAGAAGPAITCSEARRDRRDGVH